MLTGDVPGDEDTARWASELRDSDSGRSLTDPGGSGPVETPSYPPEHHLDKEEQDGR